MSNVNQRREPQLCSIKTQVGVGLNGFWVISMEFLQLWVLKNRVASRVMKEVDPPTKEQGVPIISFDF